MLHPLTPAQIYRQQIFLVKNSNFRKSLLQSFYLQLGNDFNDTNDDNDRGEDGVHGSDGY